MVRKYGPGGEGIEHKRLKEWIAQNPEKIGLADVKRTKIEYTFTSGDIADIVFELDRNKCAVVEIETIDSYTGSYQVLKYKVLKCAELGMDIKCPEVEAILVAWSIPQQVRDLMFCVLRKNSIKHEISASMSEGKGHGNANSRISGICGGTVQRF